MGALSVAIAASAVSFGAEIITKAPVTKIMVQDSTAKGVELGDGTIIRAKYIVSNADPKQTFLKLVGRDYLDSLFRKGRREDQGSGLRPESERGT